MRRWPTMKSAHTAWIADAQVQCQILLWLPKTWLGRLPPLPLPSVAAAAPPAPAPTAPAPTAGGRSKLRFLWYPKPTRAREHAAKKPPGCQAISISSNIISISYQYHSISCAHLCVLVFVYHVIYHVISCGIMNHDITWYIVISHFVFWGLGPWSGGMISCDIMWYHVGWTAWSSRFDFGVISLYIIIISCVGIMSIYHQKRDMIWHDMAPSQKKDDILIYHVSTRDMIYMILYMIYHDTWWYNVDIWWYIMISCIEIDLFLYWKKPQSPRTPLSRRGVEYQIR